MKERSKGFAEFFKGFAEFLKVNKSAFLCLFIISTLFFSICCFTGCQFTTKSLGGTTTVTLEPGEKLEENT